MNEEDLGILDEVDELLQNQTPPPPAQPPTAPPPPAQPSTASLTSEDWAILNEVDELVPERPSKKKSRLRPAQSPAVRWIERDEDAHIIPKRPAVSRRQSGHAKPCHSESAQPSTSTEACLDPGTASETTPDASLLQDLLEYQMSSDEEAEEVPKTAPMAKDDWSTRNLLFSERWRAMRPSLLNSILAQENVASRICSQCRNKTAAVRCRDCLPCPFFCAECDISRHKSLVLHNREGMTGGFFRPLPPTSCVVDMVIRPCERFLPIDLPAQLCGCPPELLNTRKGKDVALITNNGRYDLNMPHLTCDGCQATWDAGVDDLLKNGYWPATLNFATVYETDLFYTFEELKMASPGLSLQAFLRGLEKKTLRFGRSGNISPDAFQKSFFEWAHIRHETDSLCKDEPFCCPACTPAMLAVSVDGNRKHYRFRSTARSKDQSIFGDAFIASDEHVSKFVDDIHTKVKHVSGRGVCGGEWSAARETSERSRSRIDEEGLELAVCRHGVLLSALNMFRGEIYAYPMFLQQQVACQHDVTFFCMDVACKYWPYLQKVCASCPYLRPLQNMRPFLSVVHAKAHDYKCEVKWSGAYQDGAGSTLGEEVEQCNAFLSRIAVTTKHMSKEGRNDMLTLLAMRWNDQKCGNMAHSLSQRYHKTSKVLDTKLADLEKLKLQLQLQDHDVEQYVQDIKDWADGESATEHQGTLHTLCQKIEALTSSIKSRNQRLYDKNDSNKGRHRIRQKLRQEKTALKLAVEEYNLMVPDQALSFDSVLVTDHPWPWQLSQSGPVDFSTKRQVFNQSMAVRRLKEEKAILLREMRQHWGVLKRRASVLSAVSLHQSEGHLSEDARSGLACIIRRKKMQLRHLKRRTREQYIDVMTNSLVEPVEEELDFLHSESEFSDSEDE